MSCKGSGSQTWPRFFCRVRVEVRPASSVSGAARPRYRGPTRSLQPAKWHASHHRHLDRCWALKTIRHMTDGIQLRAHRQGLGLSQAKLSEISGIPQHLLSSFELGKSMLDQPHFAAIHQALADIDRVTSVTKREKRYRQHTYEKRPVLPERRAKASQTGGTQSIGRYWTTYIAITWRQSMRHRRP